MRSRLEAFTASWFDANGIEWAYEPTCFADEQGQYLPDFGLQDVPLNGRRRTLYVEVKPAMDWPQLYPALRRMEAIWVSQPDAAVLLFSPSDVSFHHALIWGVGGDPAPVHADWVHCLGCDRVSLEEPARLAAPFTPDEEWVCAYCYSGDGGYDIEVPWFSQQYYDLKGGRRAR